MAQNEFTLEWERGKSPAVLLAKLNGLETVFFDHELPRAAGDIALAWEREAKKLAPVDTGTLRADIAGEVEQVAAHTVKAVTGNSVVYAPLQEIKVKYLRRSLDAITDYVRERVEEAFVAAARTVS